MQVNKNDAIPQATYDAEGKLVPLPDETEEQTAARESVILYGTGQSPNHPRDVFPDYDPNGEGGDVTEDQTKVNDVFAQRPIPSHQDVDNINPVGGPDDTEEDEDEEANEEATDDTDGHEERAAENEAASPRNPPDNESPKDRRERERKEREERARTRRLR